MKKVFHKIMSLSMAFVVLFSTMSFTVDMHYCGGTLMDSAVFQKVKKCGMEMEKPLTEECSITKNNCCSDEQIVLDGQDELQVLLDSISFEHQVFIASFIYSYSTLFEDVDQNIVPFTNYNPPFLIRDIQKLQETYLI